MNIKISNNISHESTNSMKEIILLNNMWGKNQGLKLDSTTCISNNSSKLLKIDYDGTKKSSAISCYPLPDLKLLSGFFFQRSFLFFTRLFALYLFTTIKSANILPSFVCSLYSKETLKKITKIV